MDTQLQFSNSREQIKSLTNFVLKLKEITERMVLRCTGYASDMLQFGKELGYSAFYTFFPSSFTIFTMTIKF